MKIKEKKSGLLGIFRNIRWQLLLYDIFLFAAISFVMTWLLYLTTKINVPIRDMALTLGLILLFKIAGRVIWAVYRQIWRYGGVQSYIRLCIADGTTFLLFYVFDRLLPSNYHMAFVWTLSIFSVDLLFALFIRMVYRFCYKYADTSTKVGRLLNWMLKVCSFNRMKLDETIAEVRPQQKIKIAIIGAGRVGVGLAVELKNNRESVYAPVLFIDVNEEKIGRVIDGVPVIPEEQATNLELSEYGVQEVVLTLPHVQSSELKELYERYTGYGLKVKVYDYPQMQTAEGGKRMVRDFDVEELLFRKENLVVDDQVAAYYKGKTVLVTGGGGSIGSELCRQLARIGAAHIIILDIYENNAYDIQQELGMIYKGSVKISVEIISVTDRQALRRAFEKYRPDVVLHAAAHKHVPLMEHNCLEAAANNVFGTLNVVETSEETGVSRFIMISTDKAVNPTNVMGATKRLCEQIVLNHGRRGTPTSFSATRFGNVLGSNGSVIPLFKRQLANGGPLTVTDKRIVRYFMTIPEASQLVLTSGAIARNGQLFVLDMGHPVKIIELAESIIRLSGLTPYKDVDIVETGLRPGEKLYEELLVRDGSLGKTDNEKIFIETDEPITDAELEEKLRLLKAAIDSGSDDEVRETLHRIVETFHIPEEINRNADKAEEVAAAN